MLFEQLIGNLGHELRVKGLALNENGACALKLDAGIYAFERETDGEAFSVRAHVGRISRQDERAMAQLLTGNFFKGGVGGSALGVDLSGDVFLTQRFILEEIDFPQFMSDLSRYVSVAEYWSTQLSPGLSS